MPGCVIDIDAYVDSDGGIYDSKISKDQDSA